jgi:hypothetical protein
LARSGTSVWVCEPQSVSTAVTSCGLAGSVQSKTRMPSHESLIVADWNTLFSHADVLREESVDVKNRLPQTVTSFCAPGQCVLLTTFGLPGALMSVIWMPS